MRGVDPEIALEQALAFLARRHLKNIDGAPVELASAFVLELVVGRGHGQRRSLVLLGLGFGREVTRDDLVLDRAVALEAQHFIGNAAQCGDAPQGVQPPLFLELGEGGLDLHVHRGALERLFLAARGGAVVLDNGVGRLRGRLSHDGDAHTDQ